MVYFILIACIYSKLFLCDSQSEMKAEMDRFAREKKELSEQIQEIESQLDWVRSERDDEIAKLTSEKKVLQDRLHDADTQLSQLKSRKRDELKVEYIPFFFPLDASFIL